LAAFGSNTEMENRANSGDSSDSEDNPELNPAKVGEMCRDYIPDPLSNVRAMR